MGPRDCAQPKYYVVTFPDSKRRKPRVVRGWKAVLCLQEKERVAFRGFHTEFGAELHLRNLRAGPPWRKAVPGRQPLRPRPCEPDLLRLLGP